MKEKYVYDNFMLKLRIIILNSLCLPSVGVNVPAVLSMTASAVFRDQMVENVS
jgi:hypothetical protein